MDSLKPTKIYYQDSGYPIQRNLVGLPFENYIPQKKIGLLKVLNHLHYKLRGSNPLLSNTHWELFEKNNAVWHFFNGVSFGKTPWVVTYETFIPRWPGISAKLKRKGIKALAGDQCKKLIALSNCTKEFQIRYLQENYPSFTESISKKITVIYPPQKQLISSYDEKGVPANKLIFTIVGALFFTKGGKEILEVFSRLFQQNVPVELNIISTLKLDNYAAKPTESDVKKVKKIINKYSNRIHYYEKLPNAEVLKILKSSHVGLLPSYAETFGYSVLEAQACGCSVITTDIRAFPEINNNRCGWVIEVPKNRWGNGVLDTPEERFEFSNIIQKKLFKIITDLISTPGQIAEKGRRSLKRIKEKHAPGDVTRKLEQIYYYIV